MRTLDLGREFDVVFIQDAIMYLLDGTSVQAALAAAYRHCRPGGRAGLAAGSRLRPGAPHGSLEPGVFTGRKP